MKSYFILILLLLSANLFAGSLHWANEGAKLTVEDISSLKG